MDPLIFLVILFIICIVVSIIGVFLLFFIQTRKIQNVVFFILACWALYMSYKNASAIPMNYIGEQMIAWSFGFLAAIALLMRYAGRTENRYIISNVMVTISVVSSVLGIFLFSR